MSDEFQLWPEQSTSALVCLHPSARYFTLWAPVSGSSRREREARSPRARASASGSESSLPQDAAFLLNQVPITKRPKSSSSPDFLLGDHFFM
jgi:hypothetical protein